MNESSFRVLTDKEIADCVKLLRQARQWSQEQLSEISRVNLRTVQRVESGKGSSIDTRRRLAIAFEADDIDAFNKPSYIPSADEAKRCQDDIKNTCQCVKACRLTSARELLNIAKNCDASSFSSSFKMSSDAEEYNSLISSFFNDYKDCHELYSHEQKVDVEKDIQTYINKLKTLGVSLVYAMKDVVLRYAEHSTEAISMKAVYVIAFPTGKEPEELIIPNEETVRL